MEFTDYDTRLAAYAVIVDDRDRMLLTWYNGGGTDQPAGWSLPGGGVDFEESVEDAIVREAHEETGFDIAVEEPLATHSFARLGSPAGARPFKAVRILYRARIIGGELGTLEVDGTTDFAAWMPVAEVLQTESRADIVEVAVTAWRRAGDRHRQLAAGRPH